MLTIWHNPRCRKSRETLALIEASGQTVSVRLYLQDIPTETDIRDILRQLGFEDPRALMRRGESVYKDQNLKLETDGEILVKHMSQSPILIERPIVTNGFKAILGRPPEAVNALL